MKYLKIWNVVLWIVLAYDVFALILALVTGGTLWWVSALAVLIMIGTLFLNQFNMKNYTHN